MIRQTTLPFKLEMMRDMITPYAGLAVLGGFAAGLGLLKSIDRYLPKPGSGAGYHPSEDIFPLILMSMVAAGAWRTPARYDQIKDSESPYRWSGSPPQMPVGTGFGTGVSTVASPVLSR